MIVSVSGACSRAGKTALAETLLRELKGAAAVKFTTTEDVFERCPRGSACIVCDIEVPFRIVQEKEILDQPGTDTQRLGAAGASQVIWAIARQGAVATAWKAVRARLGGAPLTVMEGSTIVATARPELTTFVVHPFLAPERWKPGTAKMIAASDFVIVNRPRNERRAPSLAVMQGVARRKEGAPLIIGDVTQPLSEWAPALRQQVQAVAARAEALARA